MVGIFLLFSKTESGLINFTHINKIGSFLKTITIYQSTDVRFFTNSNNPAIFLNFFAKLREIFHEGLSTPLIFSPILEHGFRSSAHG
jgi:hypothetical protein